MGKSAIESVGCNFSQRRSCDLAHTAISPRCATAADRATDGATDCATTDRAATDCATTAATDCAATAATGRAAAAATGRAATAATTGGQLHAVANVFFIKKMERGETDVGHFLFAKYEALIRRGIVRLRDISNGRHGR